MDPRATIDAIERLSNADLSDGDTRTALEEHVEALDTWLRRGGFTPVISPDQLRMLFAGYRKVLDDANRRVDDYRQRMHTTAHLISLATDNLDAA